MVADRAFQRNRPPDLFRDAPGRLPIVTRRAGSVPHSEEPALKRIVPKDRVAHGNRGIFRVIGAEDVPQEPALVNADLRHCS